MTYKIPKGTFDILPEEPKKQNVWKLSHRYQFIEETTRKLAHDYGFREIRTPIFEQKELFIRGVGETSDIVSKEMYLFEDKAGRQMSLRPEGTAPVIRSFVENRLEKLHAYHKFFYIGPFFRYDRPQAGRFRQFHQFGVEAIGKSDPKQDLEIIDMLLELFKRLGLKDLKIIINSIGNEETRKRYKEKLLDYLRPHLPNLSPESQLRFQKNPLRILDTKNKEEIKLLKEAPSILDFLEDKSKAHFHVLCELLNDYHIPYEINPKLVRGLDYYDQTVFELTSDVLGAQNALGGGGRYNHLISKLGGPDLPAIGFSIGIERLLQVMEEKRLPFGAPFVPFVGLIPLGEKNESLCLKLLYQFRHHQIPAEFIQAKNLQKSLQIVNTLLSPFCIIIGDEERKKQVALLKDMKQRKQKILEFEKIFPFLMEKWSCN